MRKTGARLHYKRVSAAPKERRCGVPCLLVAPWTLFLLLLLTSCVSHDDNELGVRGYSYTKRLRAALFWSFQASSSRHPLLGPEGGRLQGHHEHYFMSEWVDFRNGDQMERSKADKTIFPGFAVLEELDDFTTQELTGASVAGRRGIHPDGNGEHSFRAVDSSSDEKSVPAPESDGELHRSHVISSGDKSEPEQSLSGGVVLPTRIIFQELGEPVDALHYAEYGAGLLQKSGPAEDTSRICVVSNAGGTHCRSISCQRELSGKNCLWVSQEFSEGQDQAFSDDVAAEEHCHGRNLVAEVEPGGSSYLVCQTDSRVERLAENVLLGVESESNLCHDSSSNGLSFCPDETHQEGHGQLGAAAGKAEESLSSEHLESEGLQPARRTTVQQQDEEFSLPGNINSDSNDLSQQLVDKWEEKTGDSSADEIPQQTVSVVDGDDDSKVVEHASVETDAIVEFLSPLVKSDVTGGESLVEPEEDRVFEEQDVDYELFLPLFLESELSLEEPRKLQRVGSVMSLAEYKKSILESQTKSENQVNLSSFQAQKIRHSDESYNYASASHGAKVLASNKEAKGASHILTSDKDKYLRNPCGAEDKFVVLELSEETFVDTIFISNFEFHSSNLKDFEVLGSTVYPTKDWISLGKFQAENVRHRQKFTIEDPTMVRHMMVKMLTHWGSEFFCTLSAVEVFGVDVIKNLLDDWIALDEVESTARTHGSNGLAATQEESASHQLDLDAAHDAPFTEPLITLSQIGTGSDQAAVHGGRDTIKTVDGLYGDEDSKAGPVGESSAQEVIHTIGGKPPGDSVLKILMQRVKALELNQSVFDLYLGDMNHKYKVVLSEFDKDLALVTERLRNETALTASLAMRLADRELQRKEEKQYLEYRLAQISSNFTDNLDMMRWQIQSMERREFTAILLSFLCMILSAFLHLLASCLQRRNYTRDISAKSKSSEVKEEVGDCTIDGIDSKFDNLSPSKAYQCSSSFILYLACSLTILVLSV